MSALGQQFAGKDIWFGSVSSQELAEMPSHDFSRKNNPVPVSRVMEHLQANHDGFLTNPESHTPHPGDIDHGGPRNYVDALKESISRDGIQNPLTVADRSHRSDRRVLLDGNHRAVAATELGLPRVPIYHETPRYRS